MSYFAGMERLPGLPVGRAAYSDRMAYIGAELSRLVYEPFSPQRQLSEVLKKLGSADSDAERARVLTEWSAQLLSGKQLADDDIRNILSEHQFEPLQFYDTEETQALLAKLADKRGRTILVLVFRGTEMKLADFATDLKAELTPPSSDGRVHRGFLQAFENIEQAIRRDMAEHSHLPLYTFGHSLGGALALICTRKLNPDGEGATYTYGAPRTADHAYFRNIKTPIYRLEIGGDPVPMVPFGYGLGGLLGLLCFLPFNGTRWLANWLRKHLLGYYHAGFRIFIKHAADEQDANGIGYRKMHLFKSPNVFMRLFSIWKVWLSCLPSLKAIAGFHSIKLYSDMLKAYMLRRNLDKLDTMAAPTQATSEPAQPQRKPRRKAAAKKTTAATGKPAAAKKSVSRSQKAPQKAAAETATATPRVETEGSEP
ncbi:lipase family protein [Microbulbifer sp. SAOS-129_SWC]|uniref:lipase family protein n=1 Tax=Microbulbifer sp. SAOS-129_SWC TaxID=3145235 RepID=UPI0032175DD6